MQLVPIFFLESNTENNQQVLVVTQQIYCCLCDSINQYALNVGEWLGCVSYPLIQAHFSYDYNLVATHPLPILEC